MQYCPVCDVMKFEINRSFLRSSTKPKSQDKNLNISRTKRTLNKKRFKRLSLKQIKTNFLKVRVCL